MVKKKGKKIQSGFTLIELLVVISLIAIIVAFSMFGLQGAFESSRDTQRKSDLEQMSASLEAYSGNYEGFYPSRTAIQSLSILCSPLDLGDQCPLGPSGEDEYKYRSNGSGNGTNTATFYAIWAELEGDTNGDYWQLCSDGRVGYADTTPATGGDCTVN